MSTQNQPPSGGEQSQPPTQQRGNTPRLQPFTVEFGDVYCRNHTLNTPPFQTQVRGAFSLATMARRPEGMRDVGVIGMRIPDLPGQRLSVDPSRKTARLFDPCEEGAGKAALDRYNAVAKEAPNLPRNYGPVPAVEHKLNDDQLKTLIFEIKQKLEHGNAKLVDGTFPADGDIERLPGREMYDQWNQGRKPRYRDQVEEWEQSAAARV